LCSVLCLFPLFLSLSLSFCLPLFIPVCNAFSVSLWFSPLGRFLKQSALVNNVIPSPLFPPPPSCNGSQLTRCWLPLHGQLFLLLASEVFPAAECYIGVSIHPRGDGIICNVRAPIRISTINICCALIPPSVARSCICALEALKIIQRHASALRLEQTSVFRIAILSL